MPTLVERELDGYVGCGVLARGFARVRCGACGHELLVPFSCKRRGICPSCTARRAEDTAAHLVDHVLPRVPYRQWVFTFPISVRLALSRRPHLLTAALQACLRVLFSWQRRRLRRRGVKRPSCGAITFVQRFGSALQLNVHFHVLVPDGAFDDHGVFVADDPPDDDDVRRIMMRAGRRVMSALHSFFNDDDDRRREIDRLLESLDATSATPQPVLFPRDARRAPLSATKTPSSVGTGHFASSLRSRAQCASKAPSGTSTWKWTFNCKASAEALREGDGAARRILNATTTKPSALPRKQHAQARLKSGRDELWSTTQGEPHRNRKREHPLPIRHARQDVVDEVGGGVLGAARRARGADAASLA